MTLDDLNDIALRINDDIMDCTGIDDIIFAEAFGCGYSMGIKFLEIIIWYDDDDERI